MRAAGMAVRPIRHPNQVPFVCQPRIHPLAQAIRRGNSSFSVNSASSAKHKPADRSTPTRPMQCWRARALLWSSAGHCPASNRCRRCLRCY